MPQDRAEAKSWSQWARRGEGVDHRSTNSIRYNIAIILRFRWSALSTNTCWKVKMLKGATILHECLEADYLQRGKPDEHIFTEWVCAPNRLSAPTSSPSMECSAGWSGGCLRRGHAHPNLPDTAQQPMQSEPDINSKVPT